MDSAKPAEPAPAATSGAVPPPPKPKGYTNPALQAMGIPRLRLPSRNWSIFWAVVGSVSGIIIYDRYERKARRQFWKDQVAQFATAPMDAMELPRKVTVYMTPPPNDYLDISQQHFRQYIKPVLTASAVDYVVRTESRQGEIRAMVAEEVRNKRRKTHGIPTSEADPNHNKDEIALQIERGITRDQTGGVICIGRGAYKEYINGLQEGWLGPLEAPVEPEEPVVLTDKTVETLDDATNSQQVVSSPIPAAKTSEKEQEDAAAFPDQEADERDILGYDREETTETAKPEDAAPNPADEAKKAEEEAKDKRPPVAKPYILGMNRGPKVWGPEITTDADLLAAKPEDVSEPIAILEHRHILGFLNMPIRIKRFFSRRELSDQMGESTAAVVFHVFRPFNNGPQGEETEQLRDDNSESTSDADKLIVEEQNDWPSRWRQKAEDNNSEWIWPFGVDSRLAEKLRVYDVDAELKAKFEEAKKNRGKKEERPVAQDEFAPEGEQTQK